MSFILDALKKSEAERQRRAGPTLLELRITRPPRRYPLWSVVVGVLLAANIAVLLVFVLHRPPAAIAPSAAIAPVPAAASPPPPAATAASPQAAAPRAATPATPAAVTSVAPLAPMPPSELPDASPQTRNPADYEPAVSAATAPPPPAPASPASPQSAVDYASLPSSNQISGDIPAMQLDLLVYSEIVGERYALINMHRVHEGDVLPDGARVLAITPDGVAMDYRGQDFLLRSGGTAQ